VEIARMEGPAGGGWRPGRPPVRRLGRPPFQAPISNGRVPEREGGTASISRLSASLDISAREGGSEDGQNGSAGGGGDVHEEGLEEDTR
jgi:hypothetical protein